MPRKPKPATPRASADTLDLLTHKLASSGLDLDDFAALGMGSLEPTELQALNKGWPKKAALKINYYDAYGDLMHDVPTAPPFYRLRLLGISKEFRDLSGKELRYVQVADTVPCAYLPRTIDWADLMPDPQVALLITEGELKAAKACKEGFPCIGLGGVWNFKSNKYGIEFIQELENFVWLRRNVYIVFDSDLSSNPNVLAALEQLCHELERRGAFPHITWLPEVLGDGEKVGLDDFLVHHGEDAHEQMSILLRMADQVGFTRPLFELNRRFVYVSNPGLLLDLQSQGKHKPSALKEHLAAPTTVTIKELTADGVKHKRVSAAPEWLKWPLRTEVDKLTYRPGHERFIRERLVYYNAWNGWGVEAVKGDVKPFLKLLDHLFTNAEPGVKDWFIRWLAYPLQQPGTKLYTCCVLHGIRHGTGKSLIGYTMGRIYGDNFTAIKQKDLHSNFNEWAENKQFVLGDDVTGSDKRADADILKTLITEESIRVNTKFVPSFEIPDCINYYFTSNQPDSFFLEDDDRRAFIHEVTAAPLPPQFYVDYRLWLDGGGAAALFWYLLHEIDVATFNPAGRALKTISKDRMINDVRSDLASWVRHLLEDPDSVMRMGEIVVKSDLATNKELLEFYDPLRKTGTTANGLGRELRRAGAVQVLDGRTVRTERGIERYYAIRNADRWKTATHDEIKKYLEAPTLRRSPKGVKY